MEAISYVVLYTTSQILAEYKMQLGFLVPMLVVECFGYSESLSTPQRRVKSRGERDAKIIQKIAKNAVGTGAE